jgi:hypothetical protein
MDQDQELWNNSSRTSPIDDSASQWLFNHSTHALFILQSSGTPIKISLTRRCFLDCALLSLYDSYWSSNPKDYPKTKLIEQLKIYHSHLRSLVEKDLLRQYEYGNHNQHGNIKTPALLGSWVQRTLYLYGHHKQDRASYETAHLPDLSGSDGMDAL